MTETHVTIDVDGLRLEGRLSRPAATRTAAVVCHPHPRYGGSMDNNVVDGLVRGLTGAGVATLRFNFRGVGRSEGRSSDTLEETADARAAARFLAAEAGTPSVALVGYSFGAIVAAAAGPGDDRIDRLVLVALPVSMFDPGALRACGKPKLFVHGDRDSFCGVGALQDLVSALPGTSELRIVAGADHFFGGREAEVGNEAASFVAGEAS